MPFKILIIISLLTIGLLFSLKDYYLNTPPLIHAGPISNDLHRRDALAPNSVFTSVNEGQYNLHDFKGRVIILNFWATWCVPCVIEFPDLLKLAMASPDKLVLVAVSVDEQADSIETFLSKLPTDIRPFVSADNVIIAHDPDKKISQDTFQTVLYPETYIIGPDLKIMKKIVGITDWTGQDMGLYLNSLQP